MPRFDNDTFQISGLEKFLRTLKQRPPVARVGILGTTDSRKDASSNAQVGASHEFGTSRVPQRSFLRMPIREKLDAALNTSKAFSADVMKDVLEKGSIRPWMEKVAKVGEAVVLSAFATGGFGKWVPWSKGYSNNTGQLLVDTQQLRNAITSEVK